MRRCLAVALALAMTVAGDAKAQIVNNVAISSTPWVGTTYERGETIEVTVRFGGTVHRRSNFAPSLALTIGSATRQANTITPANTATSSLVFRYTVVTADVDTDGISIATGALTGHVYNSFGSTVSLNLQGNVITNASGHKVDGTALTAPVVSGTAIASSPASGDTYGLGEQISVTVTFSRPVAVTGTPQLALTIGTATRQANYASGTGTASLTFGYTVVATDADTDGISVAASALGLNSGSINDARDGTTAASLGLGTSAITNSSSHLVDGSQGPPGVTGVTLNSPVVGDTFERGERIEVTVTFNKAVDVMGTPRLGLGIGSATRQASYASGTGTASLAFRYTVVQADADNDGISIGATALTLNSGTIKVAGGALDALLGLGANAIENSSGHKVAGGTFTAASVMNFYPTRGVSLSRTHELGQQIEFTAIFTRTVTVTGTPQVALGIGSVTRQANYVSGSGTTTLLFRYTVQVGDNAVHGITVARNALTLNGGSINDARDGTFAASLVLPIPGGGVAVYVDSSLGPPGVAGVAIGSPPAGGTFVRGETIEVTVTFNKAVDVTGTPQLGLTIGSQTRRASYASGSGTASLVFRYTVVTGDVDTDGLGIGAAALSLNGGTIDVAGGSADALLGLGASAIDNSSSHKVLGGAEPKFGAPAYEFGLPENLAGPVALGFVEATDADEGDTVTYRMESGDTELFSVESATGEVRYVGVGEDFEADGAGSWELEASATDLTGLSSRVLVTVTLLNENEAPAFADSAYAFELAENVAGPLVLGQVSAADPDAGDRLAYALSAGDGERFEVDAASGQVRYVGGGEDAEAGAAKLELMVSATDLGGIAAEVMVAVALLDRNEAPRFAERSYEFEIEENAPGPVDLGVAQATDSDRSDTLAYSLAGQDASRFEVDAASGAVRYVGGGEDAEAGPSGWEFEVVVADRAGLSDRVPATVAVVNVNEAPVFADSAYAFELPENAPGPRGLGQVKATDVDEGDALAYSLAAGGGGRFEVDAASGDVRYVGSGENYEDGPPEYALTVRVADAGGLTDEATVTVTVLNVNEGPEPVGAIAPKALEAYGAAAEEGLGPYFRDPDGDALSYVAESSVSGVAESSVSETGRLSIAPKEIGAAVVTVTARDPAGLTAVQRVRVTVEASRSERSRALQRSLAAFGRSLGTETVEAIGGRLGIESSGALGRSHMQVGGRSVGCGAFGGEGCGVAALARGASGLLGVQLSIPANPLLGSGGGAGRAIDAGMLLFGNGLNDPDGMAGFGGGGFGGGVAFGGQREGGEEGEREDEPGGIELNPVSVRNLLSQSSFQLSFGGGGLHGGDSSAVAPQAGSRAGWTLWGQANAGEFKGGPDDGFSIEGRTRSAYAGLDYRFGSGLLVGLAGSRSGMESDFESEINGAGSVDARLTSLYPYLHWSPRAGLGLWGLVGAGRGSADLEEVAGGRFSAGLGMLMGALGVRQELVGPLALKADAFSVRINSADVAELPGVTANARRVRLASEVGGQWTVGGALLRTRLELGGRFDGGDAETGIGAEAGGELGFTHRATGLSLDARGRTLLAHQAKGFRDWGASLALRLQPGRERGGPSLSVEPSWGNAASGAETMWQAQGGLGQQSMGRGSAAGGAPGWTPDRVAMEVGWGVRLPGGGEVTPFGRWSRQGASGYRLNAGTRWTVLGEPGEGQTRRLRVSVELFGEQVVVGVQSTERSIGLLGRIRLK